MITKSLSSSITHAVRLTPLLTWLLVQNLLEFGPLVLRSLLQEVGPQALDGEVNHVSLHQAQDMEDLPEETAGQLSFGVVGFGIVDIKMANGRWLTCTERNRRKKKGILHELWEIA